ncbi:pre-mRNA-splicing factor CWC22 homolog [Episyrphus balteatus]|uniref:pre-mRNA-splicing factor CWC22 homolog n=1 Tax=Episyrphus balteatus TaxID=286459 RepID=UPI002485509D|nr:pre-mRNA-splicing factor CWC22 homolog [Episyrphus balteatus]
MGKSESESNSSSSSDNSESDSSTSTEEEQETKLKNRDRKKEDHATTSIDKKKSKSKSPSSPTAKIKTDDKKKKIHKKHENTSSPDYSSSASSNKDGSDSSTSSSSDSDSSGSDTEEGEVKVSNTKPIKSKSDENSSHEKELETEKAEEIKSVSDELVQQVEISSVPDQIQIIEQKEATGEHEIEPPQNPKEELVPKEVSCPPKLKEETSPVESNPIQEEVNPQKNIAETSNETLAEPEANTDNGEPDLKKKKLEPAVEKASDEIQQIVSDEQSKETKSKETTKRRDRSRSPGKKERSRSPGKRDRSRSPGRRDRSRSPGRRDRRRSREREERSRRQRSRSKDRRRRRSRSRSRSKDRTGDKSNDRRRGGRPSSPTEKKNDSAPNEPESNPNEKITERQRRTVDLLTSRTGGAYIPPAKLRMMQAEITDKASAAYQRIAWEALKKSIHGYINKVNVDNIGIITRELLKENIVRGRGLLCRSIIQAQNASPTFTHVYAALVAIINSKFPNIGELLLKRLVIQFKRAFRRNDKAVCLSASRFVAHLVNQRVAHEILALEILTLLVETPTDDSVEVAIAFLKECGMKLTEVSSKGIGAIFEMLKNILHEGKLDKRVQYMIEVVFQVRKDGFKDHQSVIESLELVEEDDQFTHLLMLDEATNTEDNLNAFKFDDMYATNEDKYKGLSKEILGSDASDSDGEDDSGSGSDESDSEEDEEEKAKAEAIIDNTETNLIALRRTIYLTINSSLDYEECAHKLMKMQLKPGQEIELCHMFLDCCAEQRTYEKFYGLLAQRFCSINKTYIEPFEEIFKDTYQTTHRLDTNRLRNVSKFFAHLLFTDAIGWDVLDCIKLNEDDTTSSSRIFIKILFQELAEYMGLFKLNEKLKDGVLTETLSGLFPKDNPRNTRFAINFFSSIGLGGLTDDLRQFLKNAPKNVPAINSELLGDKIDVSSSTSSSSSSSSSSESSSESSSSEDEKQKKKKKKKKISKKKAVEKSKKKNSKQERKKKKSKKKQETSSSESSSSSSSSSSENSSSSNDDSSSEDDRKNKKQTSRKVEVDKKNKKHRREKSPAHEIERDHKKHEEKSKRRDEPDERLSNGRSMNGRGRDNGRRDEEEQNSRARNDRRDNKRERSPHQDRRNRERDRDDDRDRNRDRNRDYDRNRDNYNHSGKNNRDHRTSGKSRNGSKERG